MKNTFSRIILGFFVLSFFTAYSQKAPDQQSTQLKLLSGEYTLNQNFKDFNNESFLKLSKCEGKSYGIIQFSTVPNQQYKAQLKDNYGVSLLSYLPKIAISHLFHPMRMLIGLRFLVNFSLSWGFIL